MAAFDIEQIALSAAMEIEDLHCHAFEGGRTQRLAKIQLVVSEAIQTLWDRRIKNIADTMPGDIKRV